MSLTKEFNKNAEVKRKTAAETETWSETQHISRFFCAAAARRKLEVQTVEIIKPVAVQPQLVRRGQLRM